MFGDKLGNQKGSSQECTGKQVVDKARLVVGPDHEGSHSWGVGWRTGNFDLGSR